MILNDNNIVAPQTINDTAMQATSVRLSAIQFQAKYTEKRIVLIINNISFIEHSYARYPRVLRPQFVKINDLSLII